MVFTLIQKYSHDLTWPSQYRMVYLHWRQISRLRESRGWARNVSEPAKSFRRLFNYFGNVRLHFPPPDGGTEIGLCEQNDSNLLSVVLCTRPLHQTGLSVRGSDEESKKPWETLLGPAAESIS